MDKSSVIIISDEDDREQEIDEIDEADGKLLLCLQLFNGDLSKICRKYPQFNKRASYRKLKTYLQTIRGCEKLATFFNNPSIRQAASVEDLLQRIDTTTPFNGLRVKKEFKKKVEEEEEEEEGEEQGHKEEKANKESGKEGEQMLLRKQLTQEQESKRMKLLEDLRRREMEYHAEMEERRTFKEKMYPQQHVIDKQTTLYEDIMKGSEERGIGWREEPTIEALFTDKLMLTEECESLKKNILVLQKEYARAVASNFEVTEMLQIATADLEKARKSLTDALKDNKRAEASLKRIKEIVTAFEARESKLEEESVRANQKAEKGARKKKAGSQKTENSSSSSSSKLSKQTNNVPTISEDHNTTDPTSASKK